MVNINLRKLSPYTLAPTKSTYNLVHLLAGLVHADAHPEEAKVIHDCIAQYSALMRVDWAQNFYKATEKTGLQQEYDRESDKICKSIERVIRADIEKSVGQGQPEKCPEVLETLWPESAGSFRSQPQNEQAGDTRDFVARAKSPKIAAYFKSIRLDPYIIMLEKLLSKYNIEALKAGSPYSSAEIKEMRQSASDAYFRTCTVIMGLNARNTPDGVEMLRILDNHNDTYLAYKKRNLRSNATPEEQVAVDVAFDESLPNIPEEMGAK